MKKKIFLTGATGFVGSNIALRLLREGNQLIFLARSNNKESAQQRVEKTFEAFDPDHRRYKSQWGVVEGNLKEEIFGKTQFKALKGKIDEIWHCAAMTDFRSDPEIIFEVNVNGTKRMLELAREIKTPRFHYISTAYVCGSRRGKVREEDLENGQQFYNSYEETKYQAECVVKKYTADYGLKTTIYRPSVVIGDSKTGVTLTFGGYYSLIRAFYLLKKIVSAKLKKESQKYNEAGIFFRNGFLHIPIRVLCAPKSLINLITVDFLTDVVTAIAKNEWSIGRTFHVVNPDPPTFEHLFWAGAKVVRMEGFRFIDSSSISVAEFIRDASVNGVVGEFEIKIYNLIKEYLPYIFFKDVQFDYSNTEKVLGKVVHPPLDEKQIRKVTQYALTSKFKRPV